MQVDANSDGTVTWEELVTFLLLKDQVNDDAAHNKYLPPAGSGSNQKGLPPAELHTAVGLTLTLTLTLTLALTTHYYLDVVERRVEAALREHLVVGGRW